MNVGFKSKKLAILFSTEKALIRKFGDQRARRIMRRLAVLEAAPSLDEVPQTPPDRRHELTGNRNGEFALDVGQPYRLIFVPDHNPLPTKPDGGLDLRQVTAIIVLDVEDYH